MNCVKCNLALPVDGRFLTCSSCQNGYHLGKPCSGVADATFSGMSATRRDSWKCPSCRGSEARSSTAANSGVLLESSSVPAESQQDEPSLASVASQLTSINVALHQLLPLKTSVDSLLPLPAKVELLLSLKPVVEELRNTVVGLQSTVDSFKEKYDSVLALAVTNEESIKDLQKDVHQMKTVMEEQSQEISRLKEELNDSQQYSRRCNMEVQGLAYTPREDLVKVMEDLSQKISLPSLRSSDIVAIHRLPTKRDTAPPVLIKFASVEIKEAWMAARGRLQRLSLTDNEPKLYFNDNLTPANKELFWMTRTKGKENGYKYIWLKNAKIYARKNEGFPALRVNSVRDLEKLI